MNRFLTLCFTLTALSGFGQSFQARQFLSPGIKSVMITNAASGSLGGFTNIFSPINLGIAATNGGLPGTATYGTNSLELTWTNSLGIWIIPTNGAPVLANTTMITVTNDSTPLFQDVPLYLDRVGGSGQWMVVSNNLGNLISDQNMSCSVIGQASAATTLNLLFVGVPDGVHEITAANGSDWPTFQWGFVPASGLVTATTNFPAWKFAGCKYIRLRSATLTTATAASIGASVVSLSLNGQVP